MGTGTAWSRSSIKSMIVDMLKDVCGSNLLNNKCEIFYSSGCEVMLYIRDNREEHDESASTVRYLPGSVEK